MTNFQLDKIHSSISFQVKHMMIAKAKGEFNEFDIEVEGDINQLESSKVKVTIQAASIDTKNEDRDNHLRSADFFDVEHYPTITFISDSGDILPPPTLRLEVGASRVIPSHDGKLTERSPCAPRFEDKLDDHQSFHSLMFDIDGRIDVPVALESTFTAECPFRKR